jgi:hypothetical protein
VTPQDALDYVILAKRPVLRGMIADWLKDFEQRNSLPGERLTEVYPELLGRASVLLEMAGEVLGVERVVEPVEQ